ncbi:CsbD family protein [Jannaschia donghaensis]|uniref:CsbD-like protein n=1 Tax=Jannaschia donghaensis TaxID=420998 RepID=A0A0M6YHD4_9RHOB|nr:CsbD family protein [Jannaschia donghaensis]CTQ48486.1 CsbD-like protein [Jannaschia donghaensis]
MANENQTEGKLKDIGGKIKEEIGDALGNKDMETEGQADQVEGKVQKGVGDVEEDFKKK